MIERRAFPASRCRCGQARRQCRLDDAHRLARVDADAGDHGRVVCGGPARALPPGLAGRRHERAGPAAGIDQARLLQLAIGPTDRVDGQAEVGREVADRRQPGAHGQRAVLDLPSELCAQLFERWDGGRGVDNDHRAPTACRAIAVLGALPGQPRVGPLSVRRTHRRVDIPH